MSIASGHGIATITSAGTVLDVWYPTPALTPLSGQPSAELVALAGADEIRGVKREIVSVEIDTEKAPADAKDAYLRLHLLSHRLVKPHGQSLEGIFGLLSNVVWTNYGPCEVEDFQIIRQNLVAEYGAVTVYSVDKFPRMVDYVIDCL